MAILTQDEINSFEHDLQREQRIHDDCAGRGDTERAATSMGIIRGFDTALQKIGYTTIYDDNLLLRVVRKDG